MLSAMQRLRLSTKTRMDWYLMMGKVTQEGLPIVDVLVKIEKSLKNQGRHPLLPVIQTLLFRLRGGGPRLIKANAQSAFRTVGSELRGMVPAEESMLIQAGESAGKVSEGFFSAADFIESRMKLRKAITGAMTKPLIYLLAFMGLLVFLSLSLFPKFEKFRPRDGWPEMAQTLGAFADSVFWMAPALATGLVVIFIGISYAGHHWVGPMRDTFDAKAPFFRLMADINSATFLSAVAGFISSGIPFSDALKRIQESSSPYMRWQCSRMERQMRNGDRMEAVLLQSPMISPTYHWLIDVYGMSMDSSGAYRKIASEMVEKVIARVNLVFSSIVANLTLVLLGGMVMWVWFSMFEIVRPK